MTDNCPPIFRDSVQLLSALQALNIEGLPKKMRVKEWETEIVPAIKNVINGFRGVLTLCLSPRGEKEFSGSRISLLTDLMKLIPRLLTQVHQIAPSRVKLQWVGDEVASGLMLPVIRRFLPESKLSITHVIELSQTVNEHHSRSKQQIDNSDTPATGIAHVFMRFLETISHALVDNMLLSQDIVQLV